MTSQIPSVLLCAVRHLQQNIKILSASRPSSLHPLSSFPLCAAAAADENFSRCGNFRLRSVSLVFHSASLGRGSCERTSERALSLVCALATCLLLLRPLCSTAPRRRSSRRRWGTKKEDSHMQLCSHARTAKIYGRRSSATPHARCMGGRDRRAPL